MKLRIRDAFAVVTLGISALAFFHSPQYAALGLAFNYYDPLHIADFRLSLFSTDDFIGQIEESIAVENFSEAEQLVTLARDYGHEIPDELVAMATETTSDAVFRNGVRFVSGAATGHVESLASLSGALASDYLGFGDVRDVSVEGSKLIAGVDYDQMTLGLSVFGLATLLPGSGGLDAGASILKAAHRAGGLSAPFRKNITRLSLEVVDVQALKAVLVDTSIGDLVPSTMRLASSLKEISWSQIKRLDLQTVSLSLPDFRTIDTSSIRKEMRSVVRTEAASELHVLAKEVGRISIDSGLMPTMSILKYVDDTADLAKFQRVSKRFGDKTGAVVKVLGKKAIQLGELTYMIATAIACLVGWVIGLLWFLYSVTSVLRGMLRGMRAV